MIEPASDNARLQQLEASHYALWLEWGTRAGLLLLVVGFAAYVMGFMTPLVSLHDLPLLWNQPVAVYLQKTGTPTGWGWLALAGRGDILNLVGIAILSGCSVPPLLGLVWLYLKRRDYVYAGICAAIVLVLALAASGLLSGGH